MQEGTEISPGYREETASIGQGLPWRGDVYAQNCPTRLLLDRIADKWTVLLLTTLSAGPMRFNALKRRVDGVSQKMLSQTLRQMERDGLVLRLKPVNDQRKLYVSLTPAGTALYESAQAEVEETYRLLEAQFTTEKLQQLTSLLEEFIALGVPAGRGDEEE